MWLLTKFDLTDETKKKKCRVNVFVFDWIFASGITKRRRSAREFSGKRLIHTLSQVDGPKRVFRKSYEGFYQKISTSE